MGFNPSSALGVTVIFVTILVVGIVAVIIYGSYRRRINRRNICMDAEHGDSGGGIQLDGQLDARTNSVDIPFGSSALQRNPPVPNVWNVATGLPAGYPLLPPPSSHDTVSPDADGASSSAAPVQLPLNPPIPYTASSSSLQIDNSFGSYRKASSMSKDVTEVDHLAPESQSFLNALSYPIPNSTPNDVLDITPKHEASTSNVIQSDAVALRGGAGKRGNDRGLWKRQKYFIMEKPRKQYWFKDLAVSVSKHSAAFGRQLFDPLRRHMPKLNRMSGLTSRSRKPNKSNHLPVVNPYVTYARVRVNYEADDETCIDLFKGNLVIIYSIAHTGWALGVSGHHFQGYFPLEYCTIVPKPYGWPEPLPLNVYDGIWSDNPVRRGRQGRDVPVFASQNYDYSTFLREPGAPPPPRWTAKNVESRKQAARLRLAHQKIPGDPRQRQPKKRIPKTVAWDSPVGTTRIFEIVTPEQSEEPTHREQMPQEDNHTSRSQSARVIGAGRSRYGTLETPTARPQRRSMPPQHRNETPRPSINPRTIHHSRLNDDGFCTLRSTPTDVSHFAQLGTPQVSQKLRRVEDQSRPGSQREARYYSDNMPGNWHRSIPAGGDPYQYQEIEVSVNGVVSSAFKDKWYLGIDLPPRERGGNQETARQPGMGPGNQYHSQKGGLKLTPCPLKRPQATISTTAASGLHNQIGASQSQPVSTRPMTTSTQLSQQTGRTSVASGSQSQVEASQSQSMITRPSTSTSSSPQHANRVSAAASFQSHSQVDPSYSKIPRPSTSSSNSLHHVDRVGQRQASSLTSPNMPWLRWIQEDDSEDDIERVLMEAFVKRPGSSRSPPNTVDPQCSVLSQISFHSEHGAASTVPRT